MITCIPDKRTPRLRAVVWSAFRCFLFFFSCVSRSPNPRVPIFKSTAHGCRNRRDISSNNMNSLISFKVKLKMANSLIKNMVERSIIKKVYLFHVSKRFDGRSNHHHQLITLFLENHCHWFKFMVISLTNKAHRRTLF